MTTVVTPPDYLKIARDHADGGGSETAALAIIADAIARKITASDDEQLRFHTRGWRADAVAETEHDERLGNGAGDLEALASAQPVRHFHGFGVHVLEAVLLHLVDRPPDRRLEIRRSAQATPWRGGTEGRSAARPGSARG